MMNEAVKSEVLPLESMNTMPDDILVELLALATISDLSVAFKLFYGVCRRWHNLVKTKRFLRLKQFTIRLDDRFKMSM